MRFKVIASQQDTAKAISGVVQGRFYFYCLLSCLFLLMGFSCRPSIKSELPVIPLKVGGHEIWVEVANKEITRSSGLMFRREMDWDNGMLFVFQDTATRAFWMKNTMIPLSIAFMDEKGAILNIAEMSPQDLTSIWSKGPAHYALEMNGGWFTKQGIKPGDTVEGVLKAPTAQD